MERKSDSGLKSEWQFSVGLHMWVMFSITGFQEGEGFSLLGTETRQDDTNDGTCAHTCFICHYRLTPHTLLTFTLRFWLIERSGVLYWLHTFCVFKFTALSSTLSYTVDVFVFSVALWGDSRVGEVWPRQVIPGFINSWKTGAIRGKAQGSSSTSCHFRSPGPVVPLTVSQHPWFI